MSKFILATNYYVSNAGIDSNSGTQDSQAWRTIDKVNSITFRAGDKIYFRRGDTFYGNITIRSSGSSSSPIVFSAYGSGANPIISGFTTLTSWRNEGGGIYSTSISSQSKTNMVLIDGVSVAMGRYPDASFLTYESYSSNISIVDNQLSSAVNWTGAELVHRKNKWTLLTSPITNHSGNTIYYSNSDGQSSNAKFGYFIQHDLRTLTTYGEWYHNNASGRFYMFFGGVNPNSKTVKVATLNNIISSQIARSYNSFQNLTFEGSIKEGVSIAGYVSNGLSIINCNLRFMGEAAIALEGHINVTIDGNVIDHCSSGIFVNEGGGISILNNDITNIGLIYGSARSSGKYKGMNFQQGTLSWQPQQSLIQYNRLEEIGYHGISFGGNNVEVKNNFINNACVRLDDGGGIYTAGNWFTGRVIKDNIIVNVKGNLEGMSNDQTYTSGVYLDDFGSQILVDGNTISKCGNIGIKAHRANNLTFTNNMVYDNPKNISFENWDGVSRLYNNYLFNNILIAKNTTQKCLAMYVTYNEQPIFQKLENNYYASTSSTYNAILYQLLPASAQGLTFAQWKSFTGMEANSKTSAQDISDPNALQFEYNATKGVKTIVLSQPMIDVTGKKYVGSLELQPYKSVVLMVDNNPAPIVDPPLANFTVKTSGIVTDELLTFTNTSTNATSFNWSFGDGQTSSVANPTHSYSNAGNYTVTLTASNSVGNSTKEVVVVVSSVVNPAVSNFTVKTSGVVTEELLTFTNTSIGATDFSWNFGDGQTSSVVNPTHSYSYAGNYTVILTASNSVGNSTKSEIIVVSQVVVPPVPESGISDNFSDGNMNGWTVVDEGTLGGASLWSVVNGELVQSSNIYSIALGDDRVGTYVYYDDPSALVWMNYQLNLDVQSNDNDGIGVMFYYQDADNYYRFEMDIERGFSKLIKKVNGVVTLLAQDDVAISEGQDYPLEISTDNGTISILLDGNEVFESDIYDTNLIQGSVAMFSWGNTGARFDNVFVEFDEASESLLMSDSFSDSNLNDWTIVDEGTLNGPSSWSVTDGELVQSSNIYSTSQGDDRVGTYLYYNEPAALSWSNYLLTLDIQSIDDDGIGVMFYYQDADNYYRFEMDVERGFSKLIKKVNGIVTLLAQDDVTIVQGQNYPLEISISAGVATILVDGDEFYGGNIYDAGLMNGTVALFCWGNTGAVFDNVSVQTVNLNTNLQLSDSFSNGNMDGWVIVDEGTFSGPSSWSVVNGELVQSSNIYSANGGNDDRVSTYAYYSDPAALSWTNYEVMLDVNSNDDDGIGIMFYYKDPNNYYRFEMDRERGFRKLIKKVNGVVTLLSQDNVSYALEETYSFDITLVNGVVDILVDGTSFFSGNIGDAGLTSGTVALYSWGNTGAHFDNVSVQSVSSNLLFSNDFSIGSLNDWTVIDEGAFNGPSSWSIVSGELVQSSNVYSAGDREDGRLGTYAYYNDPSALLWSNYQMTLNVQSNDNDGIGVMFYYQDLNNYYRFEMDNERGFRKLIKKVNGVVTLLSQDDVSYSINQTYPLVITILNGVVDILVDGTLFYSGNVADVGLASGTIAMYSWGNTGAHFDDVIVISSQQSSTTLKSLNLNFGNEIQETILSESKDVDQALDGDNPLQIKVWPNPVSDYLRIDFSESGNRTIYIYDIVGKLVYHGKVSSAQKHDMGFSDFEDGRYIVKIVDLDNNRVFTENLIKITH